MSKKIETQKNIRDSLRKNALAVGAVVVSMPGVIAQPAKAQSGGTEAPAVTQAVPFQAGGAEAPVPTATEADQALNLQAQQDASALAKGVLKLGSTNPKTESHVRNARGDELTTTTVTVAAKDARGRQDGNYTFEVVSGDAPDGQPQTDEVYSITASENAKPVKNGQAKPPVASVMIDQNPANNMAEAGGTYEVYPAKGAVASSTGNYVPISAGIEPVDPGAPQLTAPEEGAVATQIGNLEKSAKQGDPIHRLQPAFDQQGNTVNDPAN